MTVLAIIGATVLLFVLGVGIKHLVQAASKNLKSEEGDK